ncbi:hypothetical protein SAMN05421636_105336 [Pricia antarctica]|uniref:Uncharacterized protein n=1 Tax=Pricia antarctica TaxID=641691 RepID=A0A1G7DI72_9FLAO|nr:hypothetical protein [Pricia antarctica]SDE51179.1 hypothetical protein SAMN05421636_105336 [Pricia antarctica]
MKLQYTIEPIKFQTIEELPHAWNDEDYKKLLDTAEYGDTSDLSSQELKEMCLLSISDNEPDEAAKLVLAYVFGERLNQGQIDNLSHEMETEKVWEEYAELSMHEEFFNATQLLYKAYNGKFPHPEAVRFKMKVTSKEKTGMEIFEKDTETGLIRLLVQGMPKNTLINRLFDEELKGGDFKDAKDIIWQYTKESPTDNHQVFEIISSTYWFNDLKFAESFDATLETEED